MTRLTIALLIAAPFVAFYIPGLMVLLGAFALGFGLQEARDVVPYFGIPFGAVAFGAAATASFTIWEDRK